MFLLDHLSLVTEVRTNVIRNRTTQTTKQITRFSVKDSSRNIVFVEVYLTYLKLMVIYVLMVLLYFTIIIDKSSNGNNRKNTLNSILI